MGGTNDVDQVSCVTWLGLVCLGFATLVCWAWLVDYKQEKRSFNFKHIIFHKNIYVTTHLYNIILLYFFIEIVKVENYIFIECIYIYI